MFTAIEDRTSINSAVRLWADKFSDGADRFSYHGLDAFWHAPLSVWGAFNDPTGSHDQPNYWNPFGRIRRAATVEINPPRQGINTNVQGAIARAENGQRWVLHQGRLHPQRRRLSETEFDAVINRDRISVLFSDGSVSKYHTVANIDAEGSLFRSQIASFVSECETVRQHYLVGKQASVALLRIATIENLMPEVPGQYQVGPKDAKTVVKKHPDVWDQLHKKLSAKGIPCSNGRVARWGPDLRTLSERPILFEIKSSESASELQRAVGQLLLYEKLLETAHLKVLVYPRTEKSTENVRKALESLHIDVLPYSRNGSSIVFDAAALAKCIRYATND